jgi:hypothetical protein
MAPALRVCSNAIEAGQTTIITSITSALGVAPPPPPRLKQGLKPKHFSHSTNILGRRLASGPNEQAVAYLFAEYHRLISDREPGDENPSAEEDSDNEADEYILRRRY